MIEEKVAGLDADASGGVDSILREAGYGAGVPEHTALAIVAGVARLRDADDVAADSDLIETS